MLKELFSIFGVVSINNKDANKALDETTNKGKSTAKILSDVFNTTGNIFTGVGKLAVKAGKICTVATAGIVTGLSSAISRFDTLSNYPKVLSNLGFNAEDAKKSIDTLSDGIDGLPTALDDAASGVQRLVAKNSDIDKSTKYFLAMNDAIVAGNAPAEQQRSAIEQLTQAYSKGKPDIMEWRTLMMAMPGQLRQVAKAMGYIDTDALYDALKSGKVSMDEFMDTLVKLDKEGGEGIVRFQEQAHNSCDSIGTSITNLSNRFKKGFATILTSMNETSKDTSFGSIAGMINSFSSSIKNFLDKIGGAIKENEEFKNDMNQLVSWLIKLDEKINKLNPEQLDKMVTAIIKIVKAGPGFLIFGKIFTTVGASFKGFGSSIKTIDGITTNFSKFDKTISKVPSKLSNIGKSFLTFENQVTSGLSIMFSGGIFDKISSIFSTGFNKIISNCSLGFSKVSGIFLSGFNKIISNCSLGFSKVSGIFLSGFSKISGIVTGFGGKLLLPLQGIGGKLSKVFADVGPMLKKVAVSSALQFQLLKFNITEGLSQMFPNVTAGLGKIGGAFGEAFSGILGKIGSFSRTFLPIFTKAFEISAIVGLVVAGLGLLQGQFGDKISEIAQVAIEKGPEIITNLVNGIVSKIPDLINQGSQLIQTLLNVMIANLPAIIQGGVEIVSALVTGLAEQLPVLLPMAVELILTLVMGLLDNIDKLIDAAINLIMGLADGLINALPILTEKAPIIIEKLLNALINNAPKIVSAGWELVVKLVSGIAQNLPILAEAGGRIIQIIWDKLKELPGKALGWGKDMIQGFINGIKQMIGSVGDAVKGIADKVTSFLHFSRPDEGPLREYETWMPDMVKGLSSTLEKSAPKLYKTTKALAQKVSEGLDFSKIPESVKTVISGSVHWNSEELNGQPRIYSVSQKVGTQAYSNQSNEDSRENATYLIQKLIDILLAYFPQFKELMNQPLVADDGTIIAHYGPKFNDEFKRIEDRERRGS